MVSPIPDGYPRLSPSLSINGASDAIAFYVKVLGATERMRMPMPDGRIGHAEVAFGDSVIMLADEFPEMDFCAPAHYGGSPVNMHLHVTDVDAMVADAMANGAELVRPAEDQFYGDRTAQIKDPWGHQWILSTHIEDVSMEEMERRMDTFTES